MRLVGTGGWPGARRASLASHYTCLIPSSSFASPFSHCPLRRLCPPPAPTGLQRQGDERSPVEGDHPAHQKVFARRGHHYLQDLGGAPAFLSGPLQSKLGHPLHTPKEEKRDVAPCLGLVEDTLRCHGGGRENEARMECGGRPSEQEIETLI